MALYFRCFFCGQIVPVYNEKETKFVSCPGCRARIDVQPNMAISSAIPQASGCSCTGCFTVLIILALLGGSIYYYFVQKKESVKFKTNEAIRTTSKPFSSPSGLTKNQKIIAEVVQKKLNEDAEQRKLLFQISNEWRENPETFNLELRRLYENKVKAYKNNQEVLVSLYTKLVDQSVQKLGKITTRSELEDKAARIFIIWNKTKTVDNIKMRQQNIETLSKHIMSHLFTAFDFSEEASLKDAILKSPQFTEYEFLFYPESVTSSYWDWNIGVHYGFVEKRVAEISKNAKQVIAWEKICFQEGTTKYVWVIFSNGQIDKMTMDQLYEAVGK